MTLGFSSIPLAKQGLYDAIAAVIGDVQLAWGMPAVDDLQPEAVWLADAEPVDEESSIGQVSHREDYRLPVAVSVQLPADDARAAELRMWQLVAIVESAVRASSTLGDETGAVVSAVLDGKRPHSFPTDGTRVAECAVFVKVRGRI